MYSRRRFVGLAASAVSTAFLAACSESRSAEKAEQVAEPEPEQPTMTSVESLSGQDGGAQTKDTEAENGDQDDAQTTDTPAADAPPLTGPVLVAYFSRAGENFARGGNEWLYEGHTKTMAHDIIWTIGADEYEIVPSVAYPTTYDECLTVAEQEKNDDARPEIMYELPDTSLYNTIFIGSPVWWEHEPMIMRTFLQHTDLAGKSVIPFTTHGGSGLATLPETIRGFQPDAYVHEGHTVEGTEVNESYDEIVEWVNSLNIDLSGGTEEESYDEGYDGNSW